MYNQYGWNLLANPISFQIKEDQTQFSLAELPSDTRKVKLHICLQSGTCRGEGNVTWTLYTKVDIMKIVGQPYQQNAWTTYSDNCTLRLDERKIIEVSRSGDFPKGNFSLSVEILGYK